MQQQIAQKWPISSARSGGCGRKATALVTAAERQAGTRRRALLVSWVFVCWGCGTFVTATPINPAPRPLVPRAPESVQVLASTVPLEPHVDVALLEVDQSEGLNRQGLDYMIQRLREKAAELGCDAVYVKNQSFRTGDDDWLDPDSKRLLASCIVFTPPAPLETAGAPKLQLVPAAR